MSNHLSRPHTDSPPAGDRWLNSHLGLALAFGVVLALIAVPFLRFGPDRRWPGFSAQIIEYRFVAAAITESRFSGSSPTYQAQVHARWTENGVARDEWIPTVFFSKDRAWLQLQIAQHSTCMVRRNPHDPTRLIADFRDDWQPLHPTSSQQRK